MAVAVTAVPVPSTAPAAMTTILVRRPPFGAPNFIALCNFAVTTSRTGPRSHPVDLMLTITLRNERHGPAYVCVGRSAEVSCGVVPG